MNTPTEIKRLGSSGLQITWPGGRVQQLQSEQLRRSCPCATCLESRGDTTHAKPLGGPGKSGGAKGMLSIVSSSRDEELRLERIWAIGNYAIGIEWGDGHKTGVYSFGLLEGLC